MASPTSPLVNEAVLKLTADPTPMHAAPPCGWGEPNVVRRGNDLKSDGIGCQSKNTIYISNILDINFV